MTATGRPGSARRPNHRTDLMIRRDDQNVAYRASGYDGMLSTEMLL
jgi:hypothetical protein